MTPPATGSTDMLGVPMAVEFGPNPLARLERQIEAMSRTPVSETIRRVVEREIEALPAAVRRSALATLPRRGGLNRLVASRVIPAARWRPGSVLVFAVGQKQLRDLQAIDRGKIRHPVYGDRAAPRRGWTWVAQSVPARFWSRPVDERAEQIKRAVRKALDDLEKGAGR